MSIYIFILEFIIRKCAYTYISAINYTHMFICYTLLGADIFTGNPKPGPQPSPQAGHLPKSAAQAGVWPAGQGGRMGSISR